VPEVQVRRQYDAMASWYDRYWQRYLTRTLTFMQHWARLAPGERVLDVACGTGLWARLVLGTQPTLSIVGIDVSRQMLAVAHRRCQAYPGAWFQQGRASALPYDRGQFDVVVSASAFHYFDDPHAALVEMQRVLTPQGRVIVLDWCKDFLLCRLCDLVLHRIDPAHTQCYTQAEFHALLDQAGFDVVAAQRRRFGLVWGTMIATSRVRPTHSVRPARLIEEGKAYATTRN
jgi:ubiquinone/menaquinone biosynthesis C-methylase UbiE